MTQGYVSTVATDYYECLRPCNVCDIERRIDYIFVPIWNGSATNVHRLWVNRYQLKISILSLPDMHTPEEVIMEPQLAKKHFFAIKGCWFIEVLFILNSTSTTSTVQIWFQIVFHQLNIEINEQSKLKENSHNYGWFHDYFRSCIYGT